jgi:hypothetical protein
MDSSVIVFVLCLFSLAPVSATIQPAQLPRVHAFGDSHSRAGFGRIPGVTVHHLGPVTMHKIGRDGLNALNVKEFGVEENDTCIFVFGEIDIRCHVGLQRDRMKRTIPEVLLDLVQRYAMTILSNKSLFKTYGTLTDRIQLTQALNRILKEYALANGIFVLDVYDSYALPDGSFNPSLSDGSVHIHPDRDTPVRKALSALLEKIYR